jgi:hypothetical protein
MLIQNKMKMKKIITLGLMLVALAACRPEAYSEIGTPYSVTTGIDGKWTLTKVEIEDRSFPQWETREVSDYFLNANAVSLEIDANSNSYQITAASLDGLPFDAMSGTYAYDDPEYPKNMYLLSPGSSDTTTVELGNMVRTIDPMMLFQEMKSSCDEVYARYIYTFNRSN